MPKRAGDDLAGAVDNRRTRFDAANGGVTVDAVLLGGPRPSQSDSGEIVVKLDWNINENHRASFKYQNNEDSQPIFADIGGGEASLSSHWYTNDFENKSYNLNLYSD